ncbi:MAG: hypothetical protein O3B40_02770, partial [Actinobacteria bacterium]|nr:hypothetical protein [Actinomycetota bacterium]
MPGTSGRPHLVKLQQIGINEDAQLRAVTKRRYAIFGLGNPEGNPFYVPASVTVMSENGFHETAI